METTETNGTKVYCPVPQCGKPFKGNSGLSSHMAMVHKMNRAMEPLPENKIQEQKDNLSKALKKHHSSVEISKNGQNISHLRDPEVRKKAGESIRRKSLEKMAARGIHRCPECLDETPSRKVDFPTAQQLGTHRKAHHNVPGVQHEKTAARSAQLRLEREAAAATNPPKHLVPKKYVPQLPFKCDLCPRTFKNQHGLSIHVSQAHKVDANGSSASNPLKGAMVPYANGSTQDSIEQPTVHHKATGRGHHDDASVAEAVAIAHGIGYFENYVHTASFRYDLAPRQFAQRLLISLAKHYQTER